MRKSLPSVATRTEEPERCELALPPPAEPPRPATILDRRPAADRIKDALLRWLEEEL